MVSGTPDRTLTGEESQERHEIDGCVTFWVWQITAYCSGDGPRSSLLHTVRYVAVFAAHTSETKIVMGLRWRRWSQEEQQLTGGLVFFCFVIDSGPMQLTSTVRDEYPACMRTCSAVTPRRWPVTRPVTRRNERIPKTTPGALLINFTDWRWKIGKCRTKADEWL